MTNNKAVTALRLYQQQSAMCNSSQCFSCPPHLLCLALSATCSLMISSNGADAAVFMCLLQLRSTTWLDSISKHYQAHLEHLWRRQLRVCDCLYAQQAKQYNFGPKQMLFFCWHFIRLELVASALESCHYDTLILNTLHRQTLHDNHNSDNEKQ